MPRQATHWKETNRQKETQKPRNEATPQRAILLVASNAALLHAASEPEAMPALPHPSRSSAPAARTGMRHTTTTANLTAPPTQVLVRLASRDAKQGRASRHSICSQEWHQLRRHWPISAVFYLPHYERSFAAPKLPLAHPKRWVPRQALLCKSAHMLLPVENMVWVQHC